MSKLYIEPYMEIFLANQLEAIRDMEFNVAECRCVRCGHRMQFPLIARQEDVEAFDKIFKGMERVSKKHKLHILVMQEIAEEISAALADTAISRIRNKPKTLLKLVKGFNPDKPKEN